MGIDNIHILFEPDELEPENKALVALQFALIEEHHRGLHPWGRMIRACPLCQAR
jgi:hypothetical protein